MVAKVKLVEFNRKDVAGPEVVEAKLAELLDKGYTIAGQSEVMGRLTYTLYRHDISLQNIMRHVPETSSYFSRTEGVH